MTNEEAMMIQSAYQFWTSFKATQMGLHQLSMSALRLYAPSSFSHENIEQLLSSTLQDSDDLDSVFRALSGRAVCKLGVDLINTEQLPENFSHLQT